MKKRSIVAVILAILMTLFACGGIGCDVQNDGKLSVTYYEYRGANSAVVRVDEGSKVAKPDKDPTREGYIFCGWAEDQQGKKSFDFENTVIVDDTIIYAIWKKDSVSVFFDLNYAGAEMSEKSVKLGEKVAKPENPKRLNYGFIGWFADPAGETAFDFNAALNEDAQVYAVWEQHKATVSFDLGYEGATDPEKQLLDLRNGEVKAQEPAAPTRGEAGDYRFEGWYTGRGKRETKYDFNTPVVADVALHAKWTKLRAFVTFDANYEGGENSTSKVNMGEKITTTPAMTRTGYTFDDWYFDRSCTAKYDITGNAINGDVTVYAGWKANPLTVTFNYNYTGAPAATVINSEYDAVIKEPAEPTRAGDEFVGWFTDSSQRSEYIFGSKLTGNLTLYAGWKSSAASVGSDKPNANGNWEITYFLNDGIGGVFEYDGKNVEEVGNAKYSKMKTSGVEYPKRNGYLAVGWFTDAACTQAFEFNARVRSNISLYAKWLKENIFEAEYTQFVGIGPNKEEKAGYGESSNPKGTNLIEWDQYSAGASNDYYVSYLFRRGSYLEFHITAAEDISGAALVLRGGVDLYDMFFKTGKNAAGVETGDKDGFGIYVNGKRYSFEHDLVGAIAPPPDGEGYVKKRKFEDYLISMDISLKKGENIIKLVTENDRMFYGTMAASAPMVDCLKLYTNSNVSWTDGWNFKDFNENAIKGRWDGDRLK